MSGTKGNDAPSDGAVSLGEIDDVLDKAKDIDPAPQDDPASRLHKSAADDAEQDIKLKRLLARMALILMALQLTIADAAFGFYGFALGWNIPEAVMIGWLTATVIQVIGVVLIIAKSLFPERRTAAETG